MEEKHEIYFWCRNCINKCTDSESKIRNCLCCMRETLQKQDINIKKPSLWKD
jgi:hypothetical protein